VSSARTALVCRVTRPNCSSASWWRSSCISKTGRFAPARWGWLRGGRVSLSGSAELRQAWLGYCRPSFGVSAVPPQDERGSRWSGREHGLETEVSRLLRRGVIAALTRVPAELVLRPGAQEARPDEFFQQLRCEALPSTREI